MEVINVKISELKPNEKNPRKITRAEMNKLIRSIQEFGFVDPVIVNKNKDRYNSVVGGHQRIEAAKRIGMKEVPVAYVDLSEDKELLLNVALNEISGEWSDEKLFELLKELGERDVDISLTGFDEPFIDEILSANEERLKESLIDVAPAVPDKPKSRKGDVFQCGEHRVGCIDSTDSEQVKLLVGDKKADCVWLDPPYRVSYRGDNNPNGRSWDVIEGDRLRGDELYQLLNKIFKNCYDFSKDNVALYSCYASINHTIFEKALNDAGFVSKQQLIWHKHHILGHSDYHYTHEPIFYCKKKDQSTEWFGDRTHKTVILNSSMEELEELTKEQLIELLQRVREYSDVLSIKKDSAIEYQHPTQKPVELSKTMVKNNTRIKDLVLDLCAGSGSVLIAAETSKRVCYCAEISERYVDCILNRFAIFTGKDPIRHDGKKWSEINGRK